MKPLAYIQLSPATAIGLGFANVATAVAYNAITAYAVADCAIGTDGKYYACLVATTGNAPPNSTYWVEVDGTYGIPVRAIYAAIQCQGKSIRYRDDGTAPSATVGMLLPYNANGLPFTELMYNRGPLWLVKIIQSAATAKANVTFYDN